MRKIIIAICLLAICDMGMITNLIMRYQDRESLNMAIEVIQNEIENDEIKKIALTFDDGPHPKFTKELIEGLAKREVKATFFVTGQNVKLYPEIIKQIDKHGHLIGNHTYTHLELTKDNHEKFLDELYKTNQLIEEVIGKETEFIRPPYGRWSEHIEEQVDMFPIFWTIDPLDWCTEDASKIINRVIGNVNENDIILLHDCYQSTVEATLKIIDVLQEKGYEFVTVDELVLD